MICRLRVNLFLKIPNQFNFVRYLNVKPKDDFQIVYKLPYVHGFGLINRLKWYQTILTSLTLPTSVILNQFAVLSQEQALTIGGIGVIGTLPMYCAGFFTNNFIGIVYLSKDEKLAKVAYLNFWGKRQDTIIPINDFVPFCETPNSYMDPLYMKVHRFSSKQILRLNTKQGIVNHEGFNKIFQM